jgi:soluble lytic murein transglycosylase-like protein
MFSSISVVVDKRLCVGLALLAMGVAPLVAEQRVVLKTGYTLHAVSSERVGDHIRLHTANSGVTELPFALVEAIEELPTVVEELPAELVAAELTIDEVVAAQSALNGLHPELLYSVIQTESNFDPAAISRKGAIGLMQLMPATAADLQVDPYNPAQNVQGGAAYLRFLLDRYAGKKDQLIRAIAAYNAGPAAVDRYDGVPPYRETQEYVRRVLRRFVALAEAKSSD